MTNPIKVAESLTEAQRAWIRAMPDIPVAISQDDWEAMPSLFVQFTPDEYCTETGCYLGGGQRYWFGAAHANYHGDGGGWMFTAELNDLGLDVRSILTGEDGR